MKHLTPTALLLAALAISACNVNPPPAPEPVAGPPGTAGAQGNSGSTGNTGNTGDTGATGSGSTVIVTQPPRR